MNPFPLLPRTAMRCSHSRRSGDAAIAFASSGAKPRTVAASRELASNAVAHDVDDEPGDTGTRWIPLLVPMLAGLMVSVFFLIGWLGLALPLARG